MPKTTAALDSFFSRFMSRKLQVFIFACGALVMQRISGQDWVQVSMVYIGTQGAIDAVKAWRGS